MIFLLALKCINKPWTYCWYEPFVTIYIDLLGVRGPHIRLYLQRYIMYID